MYKNIKEELQKAGLRGPCRDSRTGCRPGRIPVEKLALVPKSESLGFMEANEDQS